MNGLRGKVAIITGAGTQRGIGRETAKRFCKEGVKLILNDVNQSCLNDVKQEIIGMGGEAETVLGDVSLASTASKMAETAEATFGRCDILVNNAGITDSVSILDLTEEAWDKLLTINLKSVFLCTKAVLPIMQRQRYGRIVSVSSIAGRGGVAFGGSHYAASKAGIIGFSRSVANEVAPFGITVNAIAPASIDTDILKNKPNRDGRSPEEVRQGRINRTPLKRLALADEVASTITFLASDEASFVTGVVMDVNGGVFMG